MGIDQGFANLFEAHKEPYLNIHQPSECNGTVQRWEFCYQHIDVNTGGSTIYLGVWRLSFDNNTHSLVGGEEAMLVSDTISDTDPLRCTTVDSNITYIVKVGDLIGFNASTVNMAFNKISKDFVKRNGEQSIPLMRAIIGWFR